MGALMPPAAAPLAPIRLIPLHPVAVKVEDHGKAGHRGAAITEIVVVVDGVIGAARRAGGSGLGVFKVIHPPVAIAGRRTRRVVRLAAATPGATAAAGTCYVQRPLSNDVITLLDSMGFRSQLARTARENSNCGNQAFAITIILQ